MKDTTGKRLQKYAAIMGMNQSELREILDFSKSTMSSYWNDVRSPKQNVISYISEKLNVNEAWLLGYDIQMEKSPVSNAESTIAKDLQTIIEMHKTDEEFLKRVLAYSNFLLSEKNK